MNTITDKMISLEEARFALNNITKNSFSVEEAIETVDSYVERVRLVNLAWLTDYIIQTRLTEIQRNVIKQIVFEMKSANECARELGVSLRAVYSAKSKALEIIGGYIEPILMYFQNLTDKGDVSPFLHSALQVLAAQKALDKSGGNLLKKIRLSCGADIQLTSRITGYSEKEINSLESGVKEISVSILEKYAKAFNFKMFFEFGTVKCVLT